MHFIRQLACFIVFFSGMLNVCAQTFELGVMGGGAGYIGDLNQDKLLKISGFSAGAYAKMNIDAYWAIGLHYNYGKIKANDADSENSQFRDRNLNFKTALNELSLQVDFNFLNYFAGGGTKRFTPYIFTGIGGVFYSPKAVYADKEYNLRFYQTEGQSGAYRNYTLTVPYGVGVKLRLKDNWGLFSQIGYRTAHTDYLDDVSSRYPNPAVWKNDSYLADRKKLSDPSHSQYGAPGIQRGDFRKRDTYMFVGIGISYTFVSQKCYTF
ncbi:DUF6089 family protein [Pedobacter nyackensis]|uniref:type IX secretion system protein PorG n=1 Tax=Pedobacter nyackensis TaxID=475255 RepID=UPI00292E9192|nr:DUF6089 family protein [Pedobacter nyackensis]